MAPCPSYHKDLDHMRNCSHNVTKARIDLSADVLQILYGDSFVDDKPNVTGMLSRENTADGSRSPQCPCCDSSQDTCAIGCRRKRKSYTGLGRIRFGGAYPYMVVLSVLVYWTFVSLVPIYNKFFFQKTMYPYPIATAGIQLAVVSFLLAILNIIQHWWCGLKQSRQEHYRQYHLQFTSRISTADLNNNNNSNNSNNHPNSSCSEEAYVSSNGFTSSWIFGPHLWWKIKWCFPIGALFGLKYAVTNLGLHLVPAPTHLLLQSTDLVWTLLSAWWINGEVVSRVEIGCLAGCVAGSVVLGWQLNEESSMTAPIYAIAVNLISPILLGLCLATLRMACTELMRPDNRVGGTVSAVEMTSIKLVVSSAIGLMMACFMEGGDETRDSWWVSFVELSKSTRWGVIGGALLISVFQVNCTFLTFLTSAVGLGLVGQVKIIPQWLLAAFSSTRNSTFHFQIMNLVGAILIMASAAAYALLNLWKSSSSICGCRPIHVNEEDTDQGLMYQNEHEGEPLLPFVDSNNDYEAACIRKDYHTMHCVDEPISRHQTLLNSEPSQVSL